MTPASSIQSIAWETGLQAVRDSANFESFDEFVRYLRDGLRQNSEAVRQKYTSLIIKRLFPERSLEGLNPSVWRAYRDETLLADLARVTTLEAEPVIARFVVEHLLPLQAGSLLETASLRDYISSVYGNFKRDSYVRLLSALGYMGFVAKEGNDLMAQGFARPSNSLMILVHGRLAPTPRIVRFTDIVEPEHTNGQQDGYRAPFWQLLGIRDLDDVRVILRDAETAGLVTRYAVVDQLEQVTTRYSYVDYLAGECRL